MASAKHGLYKLMAEGSTDTQTSRFQTESCHVLVADDDRLNQRILREKLNALGHKVTCVSNGELALEAMENEAFDLALLDMIMPKLGGEKVLIQMKKAEKLSEIPAIMIAGLDDQSSLARCIELGADDYLTKPYNPVLLKARIHACLEKKRLQEKEKLAKEALIESQLHLKTELAEAAVYVRSILPELLTDDIKTDWRFVPSTQLGGDSFGYHWIDETRCLWRRVCFHSTLFPGEIHVHKTHSFARPCITGWFGGRHRTTCTSAASYRRQNPHGQRNQ